MTSRRYLEQLAVDRRIKDAAHRADAYETGYADGYRDGLAAAAAVERGRDLGHTLLQQLRAAGE